ASREIRHPIPNAHGYALSVRAHYVEEAVGEGGGEGGGGDGEDPGHYHIGGNAPADGGKPPGGADSEDAAGDGMRGAYRHPEVAGGEDDDAGGSLGRESVHRLQADDPVTHGPHDPPAPRRSP